MRLRNLAEDDYLVQNYHTKAKFNKRLILIIEFLENVDGQIDLLLMCIRNILRQKIKVDSIILVTQNEDLKKVPIVFNTCIFNKVGGLSFFFKESREDTTLVYIFSSAFNAFKNPNFLQYFLTSNVSVDGLIKAQTDLVKVDIDKVY
jgi:hypothetical protein